MSDDPQTHVTVQSATDAKQGDPIPEALSAIQTRIDAGRAARIALTDRVVAVEGRAAVAGPAGATGAAGPAGNAGVAGATGAKGDAGATGLAGAKGDTGATGPAGAASTVPGPTGATGAAGAAGTPRRVETYTGTSNGSGVGTITFSPAFAAIPTVIPQQTWVGGQMVSPAATAVTTTGCTLTVMRSKATLLLTAGPFETAPSTAFTIVAIG